MRIAEREVLDSEANLLGDGDLDQELGQVQQIGILRSNLSQEGSIVSSKQSSPRTRGRKAFRPFDNPSAKPLKRVREREEAECDSSATNSNLTQQRLDNFIKPNTSLVPKQAPSTLAQPPKQLIDNAQSPRLSSPVRYSAAANKYGLEMTPITEQLDEQQSPLYSVKDSDGFEEVK